MDANKPLNLEQLKIAATHHVKEYPQIVGVHSYPMIVLELLEMIKKKEEEIKERDQEILRLTGGRYQGPW